MFSFNNHLETQSLGRSTTFALQVQLFTNFITNCFLINSEIHFFGDSRTRMLFQTLISRLEGKKYVLSVKAERIDHQNLHFKYITKLTQLSPVELRTVIKTSKLVIIGENILHTVTTKLKQHKARYSTLDEVIDGDAKYSAFTHFRNLVIFEVFGVKFSAKKSIFQN